MSLFSLSFSLVNCEKKILLDFLLFLLLSRNKRFSTFKSSVYFFPPFKVPPLSVVKRSQSLLFARFFFLFFYRLTFHVSSSKFHMHIFFKVFPSALSMTKYLYLFIIYYYYVYYNFFFLIFLSLQNFTSLHQSSIKIFTNSSTFLSRWLKFKIQNSLLFSKFLSIQQIRHKIVKIRNSSKFSQNYQDSKNPLLTSSIKFSPNRIIKIQSLFFRFLLRFSQNCQNSRSFFDPKFPQNSPLFLSLSFSVQNFLKIVEKFTNSRKKKEWEENGERTRLQGVVPP